MKPFLHNVGMPDGSLFLTHANERGNVRVLNTATGTWVAVPANHDLYTSIHESLPNELRNQLTLNARYPHLLPSPKAQSGRSRSPTPDWSAPPPVASSATTPTARGNQATPPPEGAQLSRSASPQAEGNHALEGERPAKRAPRRRTQKQPGILGSMPPLHYEYRDIHGRKVQRGLYRNCLVQRRTGIVLYYPHEVESYFKANWEGRKRLNGNVVKGSTWQRIEQKKRLNAGVD